MTLILHGYLPWILTVKIEETPLIQQPIDVTTELPTITLIINGLKEFDLLINKKINSRIFLALLSG